MAWLGGSGTGVGNVPGRAYRVFARIAAQPQPLIFLRHELREAAAEPPAYPNVGRLISDLDANSSAVRQRAGEEVKRVRRVALPALERALEGKPSLDPRRRVEGLPERLERLTISPQRLRLLRAPALLEEMNPPESRHLLEELAEGKPEVRLRAEA